MNGKRFVTLVAVLVLLTLLSSASGAVVLGSDPGPGTAVDETLSPMGVAWHTCNIVQIGVEANRIHVRCTTAPSGYSNIFWFASALDSATAAQSNRLLVMMNTAYALGKPMLIGFDTNAANNPPGCQTNDCRKLLIIDLY